MMEDSSSKKVRLFLSMFMLLGSILACGSPTNLVTLNLKADQVESFIRQAAGQLQTADWVFVLRDIELMDGFIRLHGEYQPQQGQNEIGAIDLNILVHEGVLSVEVANVYFGGSKIEHEQLQLFNTRLASFIAESASINKEGIEIVSVKITPQAIQIQIRYIP